MRTRRCCGPPKENRPLWIIPHGRIRSYWVATLGGFPLGQVKDGIAEALAVLFKSLMDDFKTNSFRSYRGASEFQQFRWEKAKPIIDEIDRVLAQHYGFTDEELDFMINYDIKYRMGGADGNEEKGQE